MTGDNSGQVKIWDWQNSQSVFQENLCEKGEKVADLSFSRDFRHTLVGCLDKKMMFWERKEKKEEF